MSRWFRHYAGMMRDEKLVAVAIRAKQPVERVIWIWGAILESASEIDDGGRFEVDPIEVAYFLRTDEADVVAVFDALATAGRLADGVVVKWSDRQYQSDKSAERQARYRERKQGKDRHGDNGTVTGDVTPPSRDAVVTPQDTDTDTDTEEKQKPAVSAKKPVRWDAGQKVPTDWIARAQVQFPGIEPFRLQSQIRQFEDYWPGQQGKSAAKTDWETAFIMWIRKAFPEFEVAPGDAGAPLVVLSPDDPDFLAVQAMRGQTIQVGKSGKMTFKVAEVEQARKAAA